MKKKIIVLMSILIVSILVSCFAYKSQHKTEKVSGDNSYKEETERIHIFDNSIYLVRHKIPIQRINGSYSTYRLLGLDSLIKEFDPTLEKFDLSTGKLVKTYQNNYMFHSGEFIDDYLFDDESSQNVIKIYTLDNLNLLQFTLKNNGHVKFDYSKKKFYEKKGKKLIRLNNENIIDEFEVTQNIPFDNVRIDSDLILIITSKEVEKKQIDVFYIYNLVDKSLKKADFEGIYSFSGFKNLKIVAYTYGVSEYSLIELIEDEEVYKVKSIKKIHKSIKYYDEFCWDKKNNKFYFYEGGQALFNDEFDLYQYDENTLEQKIIHVKLQR